MHRDHVTLVFVAMARLSMTENNSFDTLVFAVVLCPCLCPQLDETGLKKYHLLFLFLCSYAQCWWPQLDPSKADDTINVRQDEQPVHALLLADTHLLGSRKGHWFDKLRR